MKCMDLVLARLGNYFRRAHLEKSVYHLLGCLSWVIKSFQDRPGTNAVPAVSTLHASATQTLYLKLKAQFSFHVQTWPQWKCPVVPNAVVPLTWQSVFWELTKNILFIFQLTLKQLGTLLCAKFLLTLKRDSFSLLKQKYVGFLYFKKKNEKPNLYCVQREK